MPLPLPLDFKDHPWHKRKWYELQILLGLRRVKTTCCLSWRGEKKIACKGCFTLYNSQSPSRWRRFLWKIAKKRED